MPLGQYLYNMPNDEDSGVEASVDKISIGNSEWGIYEFYAMYMGMLRAAGEMDIRIENVRKAKKVGLRHLRATVLIRFLLKIFLLNDNYDQNFSFSMISSNAIV